MLMIDWKGVLFPTSEWLMDRHFSKTFYRGEPRGVYQPKPLRETHPYLALLFLIRMFVIFSLLMLVALLIWKLDTVLDPLYARFRYGISEDEGGWGAVDSAVVNVEPVFTFCEDADDYITFQSDEQISNAMDGILEVYCDTIIAYNSRLVLGTENYGTGLSDKE